MKTQKELEKLAHDGMREQLIATRDVINHCLGSEFATSDDDGDAIHATFDFMHRLYVGWMMGYDDASIVTEFKDHFLKPEEDYADQNITYLDNIIGGGAPIAKELMELAQELGWKDPYAE